MRQLFRRVEPVRDGLRQLRARGCSMKLSVVQYIWPDSDLGFAIDEDFLQLLAEVGAFIDIDQYCEDRFIARILRGALRFAAPLRRRGNGS